MRAAIDTNILVRAIIRPSGSVGPVVLLMRDRAYVPVYSLPMLNELNDVLRRPRIRDRYELTEAEIRRLVRLVIRRGLRVIPFSADCGGNGGAR